MTLLNKLENILKYLFKSDFYIINTKHVEKYYYYLYNNYIIYITYNNNKHPSNIKKICITKAKEYLNNLSLHLNWLMCYKVNCNIPPNIIYLECCYCDIHNLSNNLKFILYFNNIKLSNKIVLNNDTIKNNIINLIYNYYSKSIKYHNINFNLWLQKNYNLFYILK